MRLAWRGSRGLFPRRSTFLLRRVRWSRRACCVSQRLAKRGLAAISTVRIVGWRRGSSSRFPPLSRLSRPARSAPAVGGFDRREAPPAGSAPRSSLIASTPRKRWIRRRRRSERSAGFLKPRQLGGVRSRAASTGLIGWKKQGKVAPVGANRAQVRASPAYPHP
jgi:hypothetical protein